MTTLDLPTYVSISEAIERYHLGREALTRLVETGKVRAVEVDGDIAVAEEDVRIANKKDRLWARVEHLNGEPIAVGEARRKYDIGGASLNRWIERGYVRVLKDQRGGGRGRKRILNEADVAYAALVAEERGRRQGRRIFVPEFVPPLAWDSRVEDVSAIEVYPAATLTAYGIQASGYKGKQDRRSRDRCLEFRTHVLYRLGNSLGSICAGKDLRRRGD